MSKITIIEATELEEETISSFITKVNRTIGRYIDPLEIYIRPRVTLPYYGNTQKNSMGFWRKSRRRMLIASEALSPEWLEKHNATLEFTKALFGHEFLHVLQGDWWLSDHWVTLGKLLRPIERPPNTPDYSWAGSECLADDLGAALFGLTKPAFPKLYKRSIPKEDWERAADIAISCFAV